MYHYMIGNKINLYFKKQKPNLVLPCHFIIFFLLKLFANLAFFPFNLLLLLFYFIFFSLPGFNHKARRQFIVDTFLRCLFIYFSLWILFFYLFLYLFFLFFSFLGGFKHQARRQKLF